MTSPLKTAAIPRAGHDYQDLVGISFLLDFYMSKSRYLWVVLESEDQVNGYLDDVVAALADGSFEIVQVKYTVDSSRYFLDWGWLLEKTGRGTSLIEKWATTLRHFSSGPISLACLRTNRRPDIEFTATLTTNGHVQFDRLSPERKAQITTAIGGIYLARRFFRQFRFIHSEPLLDDLEDKLRSSVVPAYADASSWLLLRAQAKRWAMVKGEPPPDGRITYNHLTQLITRYAPRPMPQSFSVPASYTVPSRDFHFRFLRRITKTNADLSVLWGTPGRGKSTYLSFLTSTLRAAHLPVIRHHYFLSLDDTTSDRFSFVDIATSLMDQMRAHCPEAINGLKEQPVEVRQWVEACGRYFLTHGKPFFVIIDGLDHVWRERQNLTQLDHLFDHLLPCPPNVRLVVGTQRISDDKLPAQLVRRAPRPVWHEIPAMDERSVVNWLGKQYKAGRLRLPRRHSNESLGQQIGAIGTALHKISNGHPLHLIYSFEALIRGGGYVTPEDVQILPPCPSGNIEDYYRLLWRKLPAPAERIMHVVAGSDFHWPVGSLVKLFGPITEIDFLLDHRRSGLIPFHGSMLVFVRGRSDHKGIFQGLVPRIINWLKKDAPEFYRWGWLWLMQAKGGDARPLIKGANRSWAIASIAAGRPLDQMHKILAQAEALTFASSDYATTIVLRSLKTRLANAPEFQLHDFAQLTECALSLARDNELVSALADNLPIATEGDIVALAKASANHAPDVAHECVDELARRITLWIELRHRSDEEFLKLTRAYIDVICLMERIDVKYIVQLISVFRDSDDLNRRFIEALVRHGRIGAISELIRMTKRTHGARRHEALNGLVRAGGGIAVDIEPLLRLHRNQPLSGLAVSWLRYHKAPWTPKLADLHPPKVFADRIPSYRENFTAESYFYEFFFHALAEAQARDLKKQPQRLYRRTSEKFRDRAESLLGKTAVNIATGQYQLSFATPYFAGREISPLDFKPDDPESAEYFGFRSAMRRIATDLHILKQPTGQFSPITNDELKIAETSLHWNEERWIEEQLMRDLRPLATRDADVLLNRQRSFQDQHVVVFNERAEKWIQLTRLALLYDSPLAIQFLARASNCAIGYGWRKDLWMMEVLNCVVMVHREGAANGLPMLRRLVPIIEQITTFTDGDETDYVREELIDAVASIAPDRLPTIYARHIDRDEYRYANTAFLAHTNRMDLTITASHALIGTFVERKDISALKRIAAGSSVANSLLERQVAFLGGMPRDRDDYRAKDDKDEYGRSGTPPDVKRFRPAQFRDVVKALAYPLGYEHQREGMRNWLRHWDSKGKAVAALAAMKEYFENEENPHEAEQLLDEAFDVSLRVQGKKAAYYWLKRAHIHRNGWSRFMTSSAEVLARLEKAARYYPQSWRQFIADTGEPAPYWRRRNYSFAVGITHLVRYLLLVGQKPLAVSYTRACIKIVEEEVSDQPIPDGAWFQ
jgi:hypothetical protein